MLSYVQNHLQKGFLLIHESPLTDALFLLVSKSARSQRRRRELHGADSDMAQRLETAMAHALRLGSLAELHG